MFKGQMDYVKVLKCFSNTNLLSVPCLSLYKVLFLGYLRFSEQFHQLDDSWSYWALSKDTKMWRVQTFSMMILEAWHLVSENNYLKQDATRWWALLVTPICGLHYELQSCFENWFLYSLFQVPKSLVRPVHKVDAVIPILQMEETKIYVN